MNWLRQPSERWWQGTSLRSFFSTRKKLNGSSPSKWFRGSPMLLKKRRVTKKEWKNRNLEYFLLCRLARKLKKDCKCRRLITVVQRKQSLKKCRRELLQYYPRNEKRGWTSGYERNRMEELYKKFSTNLFSSCFHVREHLNLRHQGSSSLCADQQNAESSLPNEKRKSSWQLFNTSGSSKAVGTNFVRLSQSVEGYENTIPEVGKSQELFYCIKRAIKKSEKLSPDLACSLTFIRVITNRLTGAIDEHQPREQYGFRKSQQSVQSYSYISFSSITKGHLTVCYNPL